MEQRERREYLIDYLLEEGGYTDKPPKSEEGQRKLLRALFNVRLPQKASEEFLRVQDEYLGEEIGEKGITDADSFDYKDGMALWRGDITTLKADGIVNAANSRMLGCFVPGHHCIDNAIHTFAGIELRNECADIMRRQGYEEPTGKAKITGAYNLPCKYVLHTVGPVACGGLTAENERDLASCYKSCLALADEKGLKSLAFCCISTGVFGFPNARAAEIAVKTVREYLERTGSKIKVVFDVFKENDYEFYRRLLG